MTTPKQSSRWSSLLQQAVAGVENQLDNILADGTEDIPASRALDKANPPTSSGPTPSPETPVSKNSSTTIKANDRLQERLAKVIASRSSGLKKEPNSSTASSRSITFPQTSRTNLDSSLTGPLEDSSGLNPESTTALIAEEQETEASSNTLQKVSLDIPKNEERMILEDSTGNPACPVSASSIPLTSQSNLTTTIKTPAEYEDLIKKLNSDLLTAEAQRQKEKFDYVERIDALESKLRFLATETAESARISGAEASKGSLEKKLADKELQVALLLKEGQLLSKKEIDHLAIIKKLRGKISEDGKEVILLKKSLEAANTDAAISTERWKKMQSFEKEVDDKQKIIARQWQDIKLLQTESQTKTSTINELKALLEEAVSRESKENLDIANESLKIEKERAATLEEKILRLESETRNYVDKTQIEIKTLQEAMSKNEKLAQTASLEMKTELQMMEGKLELMRARAEEATSGDNSDTNVKLLRQIETLQTQYSIASDNWKSIEGSLTSRAINLEKDKDEVIRREADTRRKMREVALKTKCKEEELQELRTELSACQQELFECKAKLEITKNQAEVAKIALHEAQLAFDLEKQAWSQDLKHQLDEERQKWQEDISSFNPATCHPMDSTLISTRSPTSENIGLQNFQSRRTSSRSLNNNETSSVPYTSRRASSQVLSRSSGFGAMTRQDSISSLKEEVESDFAQIDRDLSESSVEPYFPQRAISDITSVPAESAGPSVQLVERMSSAVRRLECEKVATKEDIMRISKQRDEARAEIVSLLKELEIRKDIEKRLNEVEKELSKVEERYETTLVMLGEKSEEVEELRGDIADIKCMYRELVERTVK
ncbi:hypothetical protein K3495_g10690 [Podosphaera aphanis]|nr:hypothetical protein K3495_g10690 [Podosphaera aphanis]